MIPAFDDRDTIEAVARLDRDPDFHILTDWLQDAVNKMSVRCLEMNGDEGQKARGGALALAELRDIILAAKMTIEAEKERKEMESLDRDTISP